MPDPHDKGRRATYKIEGENWVYLILRRTLTGILFFLITLISGVWKARRFSDIFTGAFVELVIWLFVIYLITDATGRITAYIILYYYARYRRKSIKTFLNINRGVNKMGLKWFISIIVKPFLFAFGVVFLLQNAIYDTQTVPTLIGTYVLFEVIVSVSLSIIFWRRG